MSEAQLERSGASTEDEEILHVSKEMIDYPLGFVIDSGGSMTKVVYRSKMDYSFGERLKPCGGVNQGLLRLRSFNMNQVGEVIGFLMENCDVINDKEENVQWWMTGVTTQHFKKELDSTFEVKTKLYSEMRAIENYLKRFTEMYIGCFEVDLKALAYAKKITSLYLSFAETPEEKDGDGRNDGAENSEKSGLPVGLNSALLEFFTNDDVEAWAEKNLSFTGNIEYPSLLVNLGSAGSILFAAGDGNARVVDFTYGIGKIISGLAEELTGESDFENIIKMAERGKLENVDMTTDDIRNFEHEENDWYKNMPENFTIFELGGLSSHNFKGKGKYNEDDLAIGVLSAVLKLACKIIFLNAKLFKVKCILISGSLPKYEIVRHHLQKFLLVESIMSTATGMELIKIHVLKNPGFPCALGVWWENVDLQKGRKRNCLEKVQKNL